MKKKKDTKTQRADRREKRRFLLDLLYPGTCPVCEASLPPGRLIHEQCRFSLPVLKEPFCLKCGVRLEGEEELCPACKKNLPDYDWNRSCFDYTGAAKKAVRDLKYANRREYADFFGLQLYETNREMIRILAPEVILPVPVSAGRRKIRGYNQAELLARVLSDYAEVPVDVRLLARRKETRALSNLHASERRRELSKAFVLTSRQVPERILLVDDICTTGSTANEIAGLLKRNGAKKVAVVTCCKE